MCCIHIPFCEAVTLEALIGSRFVLDQHADSHVGPRGHTILISSQPLFNFTPDMAIRVLI
jgi:hypothetical protein